MRKPVFKYHYFLLLCLFFCFAGISKAQERQGELPLSIQQIIEDHAEEQDEQIDYSRLIEELQYLMSNPLNINAADEEDFQYFIFLNELQIQDILRQRKRLGEFKNMFQLQLVESLTYRDIQNLSHFVYAGEIKEKAKDKLTRSLKYGRHDVFMRYERTIETRQGYKPIADSVLKKHPNKRYLGSPDKYYFKYAYRSQNIRWGLNAEKDAGEEFFKGTQKQGFDFYSGYLMLEDLAWVDKIVLGDYNVETGQGLSMWSGLSFGKSSNVISVRKQAKGLKPSTSMNEFGFLRGIALERKFGPVKTTLFYSRAMRDANAVEIDSVEGFSAVRTLQETGYHYTQSLVDNKNLVEEQMAGGNVSTRLGNFKIGATAYYFSLNIPLEQSNRLYKKFDFIGTERVVSSLDYEFNLKDFILFGETGYTDNGSWGTLNGFIFRPASGVYLSVLHRNYQKDFQNIKGGAFSENSSNQNEKGLYGGLQVQLNSEIELNGYADHFEFDWLNYRIDAPSQGSEYMVQLDYEPSRKWSTYLRYRYEGKKQNLSNQDDYINHYADREREGFRVNFSWKAASFLKFNNRVEWSRMTIDKDNPEDGWLVYQDVLLRPKEKPYMLSFRYALFQTDSYNARLYAYEHDVLYAFSIPAYAYNGFRTYLVFKYEVKENMDFWIKVARSQYVDRQFIGNGLTRIDNPHKTDVKLQIRIKF
ncbi:MAG: helix-hairpin-helix domain-containing protein [Bacteroidales bacterium]|nr:helix-hairpin-helix domain-containing protein [Bacteroidales bacterium]MCF8327845.1 helix-hairpin-helix domain-containing protein [Bacteroidales bacterium]